MSLNEIIIHSKRLELMLKKQIMCVALTLIAYAQVSYSADAVADLKAPWEIEVGVGAIATSGNTKSTSIQANLDAKQNLQHWQNQYIFNSLFKQDEVTQDDDTKVKEKTADKYLASVKSAYLLATDKSYLFGFGSYANDKFGSYSTYKTVAIGYGDWLFSTPTFTWYAEIGPGYFQGDKVITSTNPAVPDSTEKQSGAIARLATELKWNVTETAQFKQTLSVESGKDNTRTLSETSLAVSISKAMQMKVGVAIANDTDVTAGKEKTDVTSFVNLIYKL
jgi:putative salt-induced outer membrane protein